ncbi:MAG: hypothetical protein BMS9Abin02_1385 [Anaerolineae bacterium]|nr:MAG: hypothetical protein BMS9Abin02_1385 [Anaerolineae bacterium]
MTWEKMLNGDSMSWLLESDSPGVRYLALRDLVGLEDNDPVLAAAMNRAHEEGPIDQIFPNMNNDGYWVEPGPGCTSDSTNVKRNI